MNRTASQKRPVSRPLFVGVNPAKDLLNREWRLTLMLANAAVSLEKPIER